MRGKDLRGRRFGLLLVIENSGERKDGAVLWRCRCDCGQMTLVVTNDLTRGNNKSCGCLRNRSLTHNGITDNLSGWAARLQVAASNLMQRIKRHGVPLALSVPNVGRSNRITTESRRAIVTARLAAGANLADVAAEIGVAVCTLRQWCNRHGVTITTPKTSSIHAPTD